MSECCSTPQNKASPTPKTHRCPANGQRYPQVSTVTIQHHLKRPWRWTPTAEQYYFCDDPDCDVVYFGQDDSRIEKARLRTRVGLKERQPEDLVCYCFGVTRQETETDPTAKEFVIAQTQKNACACVSRNPSGRCCLKDFPKSTS